MMVSDFQHKFILPKDNHRKMAAWCEQQFGSRWEFIGHRQGIWCTFWEGPKDYNNYSWHFKNEKDAVLFLLRWS